MNTGNLISELYIKSYKDPLWQIRSTGAIKDTSNPICVIMLVIDFETEVTMNGIENFIGNSTGDFTEETVTALTVIGCEKQALQLQTILTIASAAGLSRETIQKDQSNMPQYSIVSFAGIYGSKWNDALDKISALNELIDYQQIRDCAEEYVRHHVLYFQKLLDK